MNIILNPIIHFMEKMNFRKRFLLICVFIFAALVTISWLYISNKVKDRTMVMEEYGPAKYYEKVNKFIKNLYEKCTPDGRNICRFTCFSRNSNFAKTINTRKSR